MEVVFWIVGLVVGTLIYQVVRAFIAIHQEREQEKIDSILDRLVVMRIETDTQGFFAYDARTEKFLVQGATLNDLIRNFQDRYPNKTGLIFDSLTSSLKELDTVTTATVKI